jgi:hypothetical protein
MTGYTYPGNAGRNSFDELSIKNPLTIRIHTLNADVEKKLANSWVLNFGAKYKVWRMG